MGGIIQVDTIQNNNTSTLIAQTNTTTITIARSGQTVVIPSGTTFNASSASVNLPAISLTTGVTGTLPIANGGTNLTTYTAGNLLYASNATTLTTLPIGTSTQVLGVSSGVPAWTTPSAGAMALLATATASSSATVSFDGYFSSTYRNYVIYFDNIVSSLSNTATEFRIRYRRSNADVTSSSYKSAQNAGYIDNTGAGGSSGGGAWNQNYSICGSIGTNTAGGSGYITLLNPLGTTNWKTYLSFTYHEYQGSTSGSATFGLAYAFNTFGSLEDSTAALSGITFYPQTGNMTSGTFKLYGIT